MRWGKVEREEEKRGMLGKEGGGEGIREEPLPPEVEGRVRSAVQRAWACSGPALSRALLV